MQWTEMTIYVKGEQLESLGGLLEEMGITDCVVNNPEELIDFLKSNSDKWDMVDEKLTEDIRRKGANIKIYISDDESGNALLGALADKLDSLKAERSEFADMTIETLSVRDEDWQFNWMEYFKAFELGERLYIKPVWEQAEKTDRITVLIDPGSSFGSGMHETTRMALIALETYAPGAGHIVDVGSGSGILSVAAAKLGAGKVTVIDIDENTVLSTKQCADFNGVTDIITALCGDLTDKLTERADIVVANIFAGPVCTLCSQMKDILEPKGYFISTGIIEERADEVRAAYEEGGMNVLYEKKMGQWLLFVGQLR